MKGWFAPLALLAFFLSGAAFGVAYESSTNRCTPTVIAVPWEATPVGPMGPTGP